jgi:hypothetical protein
MAEEKINHPPHYTFGTIEVIEAIEDWGLDYHAGNVIKYVARYLHKGSPLDDLKKARWYLDRLIEKMEAKKAKPKAKPKKAPAPPRPVTCLVHECDKPGNVKGRYTGFCDAHGCTLSKEERGKLRAEGKAGK